MGVSVGGGGVVGSNSGGNGGTGVGGGAAGGGGSHASNSTTSSSNTLSTMTASSPGLPQSTSAGLPPRPHSADLLTGPNILRGLKRPSDEAHDGNPNKQPMLGAFERLLEPPPPASSMSPAPVQHGGPPTPLGGPPTPHGGPTTPHGGPATPNTGPTTPHGPPTPLGNNTGGGMGHGGGMGVNLNNQGSSKLWEKNKMLATLLAREPVHITQNQPPSQHANPQGLPQEKLPKDLEKKLQTPGPWQPPGRNQSEILTQLLTNRPPAKVATSIGSSPMGLSPQMRTPSTHTPMMCNQPSLTSQGHITSQPSLTSQSGHGVKNINMSGSGGVQTSMSGPASLSGPVSMGMNSGVSVSSPSMSTTTTNTLPSFKDSMKLNVLGTVTSSSFPEGSLPSITTSPFHTIHNSDDYLRETVINDILEMTKSFHATSCAEELGLQAESILEDSQPPSSSSAHEFMEIQKIQKSLMSDIETPAAPTVSGTGPLPPYSSPSIPSHSNYPPQYGHRPVRFPSMGPGAGSGGGSLGPHMMRPNNPQFPAGNPTLSSRPTLTNQRASMMLNQQQTRKRLLHTQQQQVLVPSNTSDVSQPSQASYQSMDDLFNNTAAPPNRNVAESQTSPNYNLLNSPLVGAGQMSPGQRIPQPPFSPHGQTTSPLPGQQYTSSGQMGGYQGVQGSQLSPRLSQGSPAPPNYPPGGQPLPQMSPTGPGTPGTPGVQVPPGQQSPAWSSPSSQRPSLMTQNPMLNAQLSFIRNDGSRQFSGGGRAGQIPTMRSVPSPGPRQSPYQGMGPPTPGTAGQGDPGPYPPSSPQQGQAPLLYQQQQQQQQQSQQQQPQQQQFRIQRTMSAPVGITGVHSPRSAHPYPPAPGHHHDPPAPPPHLPPAAGGHLPGPHSVPPSSLGHAHMVHHHPGSLPPSLMTSTGSPMGPVAVSSSGPVEGAHMIGGGPMGGGGPGGGMPGLVGGVMPQGYDGGLPPHPHNYEVAAHYYGAPDPARTSSGKSSPARHPSRAHHH